MAGKTIPVKLPEDVVEEIDELIKNGRFLSRSDLLRYGARLALSLEQRRISIHYLAEESAFQEIQEKLRGTGGKHLMNSLKGRRNDRNLAYQRLEEKAD